MRKICVVTGTRADYGLLYWLMHRLARDPRAVLQIVTTGMHLSPEFGLTYRVIEEDGFTIDAKVEMLLSSDSGVALAKSIGIGTIGFADAFASLRPDIVVLLGDRFEILAAAQAAMAARIPVAHIAGGESTEGVIDEAIRHSVTKLSHLHFVAAEPYRRRVIQLGENPGRVFNVGAAGIDNIRNLPLASRRDIEDRVGLTLSPPTFLVTYHPATLSTVEPQESVSSLLCALDAFPDATIVLTKSNADPGGHAINEAIDDYGKRRPSRVRVATSLGQRLYLSTMQIADVVVGNSSSGILEAPAMGVPSVNVGDRQRGRLRSPSVIDCAEQTEEIVSAIARALSPDFRAIAQRRESPFGHGGAAQAISETLLTFPFEKILMKTFHDLALPGEGT